MKVNLVNLKIILLHFFSVLVVWYLADNLIVEMNKRAGFNKLSYDSSLFYSLFFIIALFLCFFKCNQNSTQYILTGILLFYSYSWFFIFLSIVGDVDAKLIFWAGLIFLLPVILLVLSEKYLKINYSFVIFKNSLIKLRVEFIIMIILLFSFVLMLLKMEINFSFSEAYERRMEAREKVTGLLAYLIQMSTNSLAPILAFLGIYNKNYKYLFFAFAFAFLAFGFIGVKAPFAYVVLMSLTGYFFLKRSNNFIYFLVLIMTIVIFLGLLEFFLLDSYWIADIFVRRVNLSPTLTIMYYLDFMFIQSNNNYSFFIGNQELTTITYLIGEIYYGDTSSNANTNTFITELGQRGILGYFSNIIFLIFFYSFLQYLYKASKHKVWLAIATHYALLLLEQSYSVAFVSSGVGLITILLLMFSYKKNKNIYD
jgi:hypothetical protein